MTKQKHKMNTFYFYLRQKMEFRTYWYLVHFRTFSSKFKLV